MCSFRSLGHRHLTFTVTVAVGLITSRLAIVPVMASDAPLSPDEAMTTPSSERADLAPSAADGGTHRSSSFSDLRSPLSPSKEHSWNG